jgi:hypothetical protein
VRLLQLTGMNKIAYSAALALQGFYWAQVVREPKLVAYGMLFLAAALLILGLRAVAHLRGSVLQYEFSPEGLKLYVLKPAGPSMGMLHWRQRWSEVTDVHAHCKAVVLRTRSGLTRIGNEAFVDEEQRQRFLAYASSGMVEARCVPRDQKRIYP